MLVQCYSCGMLLVVSVCYEKIPPKPDFKHSCSEPSMPANYVEHLEGLQGPEFFLTIMVTFKEVIREARFRKPQGIAIRSP